LVHKLDKNMSSIRVS
uniref:Uncharacterized protein n=1 Tax=Solanum lycopersicum TaxID=4081 RepID=A0A3Q7G7H0_SOLLC